MGLFVVPSRIYPALHTSPDTLCPGGRREELTFNPFETHPNDWLCRLCHLARPPQSRIIQPHAKGKGSPVPIQLLTTKLYIPPMRPDPSTGLRTRLVSRPCLIGRLNAGPRSGRKLTLISAPAGFGKSTLLAEWINQILVES